VILQNAFHRFLLGLFCISSLYIVYLATVPMVFLITRVYPPNPWESGIVMEAVRFARGMPLYESVEQHATQMYGWLYPVLMGVFFKFLPVHNALGRFLSLSASILIVALLTRWVARGRGTLFGFFAVATFFGVGQLGGHYFAAGRPDMLSWLFGLLALVFSYRASSDRWQDWVWPSVFLIIAISFKQTAAGFAIIPPLAILLHRYLLNQRKIVAWPWLPLLGGLLYVGTLALFAPLVFKYMFTAFGHFPILWPRFLEGLQRFGLGSLLMLIVGFSWHFYERRSFTKPLIWTSVSVLTLFPLNLAAFAKIGGTENSMLPFFFAFWVLFLQLVGEAGLFQLKASQRASGLLITVWCLWIFGMLPAGPALNRYFFLPDAQQEQFQNTIELVRTLSGSVQSPEDGTLVFFANGSIGKNIYLERDLRGLNSVLTADLEQYLSSADYVVDVVDGILAEYVNPDALTARGYRLKKDLGPYTLWEKTVLLGGLSSH
jgi:hypothetical protein